jgi:predicted ATPase
VSGRWRLLETIRAYALDKLRENGEAEQVARRHAEFFRGLLAPVMAGPIVAPGGLPGYAKEIDNLRAALDWAFSRDEGDVDVGIGLAVAAMPIFPAMSLLLLRRPSTERPRKCVCRPGSAIR